MRILAALLIFACASAHAAMPGEITAQYRLSSAGVTIGRVTESFSRKGDTYSIQSVTRSEGVLKIFMDDQITTQSTGKVTARGLQPLEFIQRRQGDAEDNIRATFDWSKGVLTSEFRGKTKTATLPRETQDRLSLLYQFMNLEPRDGDVVLPMSNGRNVVFYTYRLVEEVKLTVPAGDFQALHYERVNTSEREPKAHVWLAKDRFNLPVRVVFEDHKGLKLEQVLVALEIR
jgi:uncharacterized protein DUF3108